MTAFRGKAAREARWLKRAEYIHRISLSLAEEIERATGERSIETSLAYGINLDARHLITTLGGK
jgi:hypothetical protein